MLRTLTVLLRSACFIVDLPREQAPTEDDIAAVMKAVTSLKPRPGLKKCFDGLRTAGWEVYGVTNGGKETSLNYYRLADIALEPDHLLSCDDVGAAKPDFRVYTTANKHLTFQGVSDAEGDRWFVAAHAWDLIAARKTGFKTAYLGDEEHDAVPEIFGQFDLYLEGMEGLLEKLKSLDQ